MLKKSINFTAVWNKVSRNAENCLKLVSYACLRFRLLFICEIAYISYLWQWFNKLIFCELPLLDRLPKTEHGYWKSCWSKQDSISVAQPTLSKILYGFTWC